MALLSVFPLGRAPAFRSEHWNDGGFYNGMVPIGRKQVAHGGGNPWLAIYIDPIGKYRHFPDSIRFNSPDPLWKFQVGTPHTVSGPERYGGLL